MLQDEWPHVIPARLEYDNFVEKMWIGDPADISTKRQLKMFVAVAVAEEAGEICGKIKKEIRDGIDHHKGIRDEMGDLLFYLVKLAHIHGYNLNEIIQHNTKKLERRYVNGTVQGQGDDR